MAATDDALPFPYPLALGTDICHIPRIQRLLTDNSQKQVDRFSQRIFSPAERSFFQEQYDKVLQLRENIADKADNEDNGQDESGTDKNLQRTQYERAFWKLSSWVAGRFAAKEAAMKAVYPHRLGWHQAEILTVPGKMKPVLVLHVPPPQTADTNEGDGDLPPLRRQVAQLSISHDGDYATATVLAVNHSA
ncbi:hypothetical protein ASPWEDRAFT_72154 [Aspergillus wentii DTO 134E9]|uniref:4'-phosphopantetheinyl transferase domain-containing protein n=1 Tax=Aspergillus wentii DTO 134E9 TaxID=1073089 RepID=A0A1L9R8F5_ASPWE|nr:uncharacterized protein ASPWEDRAFT_72154 [Aspergillus wentii DTO 134E9]OJJ31163.1 hypothetical protein ASPWEDRAFT_72154 [Aspergillus wentii DTO 134E9]